jgi:hypothetical protein
VGVAWTLTSGVEVDGSEAVRGRLTPPSTSTALPRSVEARSAHRSTSNLDGGRTSPSTTTLAVNDQVDVDDHDAIDEDL